MNEIPQIVWPLICIAVAIAQIVTAWAQARRTPPLAEQLAKEYVTKTEFSRELKSLRDDNATQNAAINSLSKSLSSEIKQMSIAIGRLEGTLSTLLK